MAIDMKNMNNGLDYAKNMQKLADEVTIYAEQYLDNFNEDKLENTVATIRHNAREIATIAAIEMLESLKPELTKLKDAIAKVDGFLTEVRHMREIISGLAEIASITTNILNFVP